MDLSMILSPAVEEEEAVLRATPAPPEPTPTEEHEEPNRTWSSDELQCAVAILQDFQQPAAEAPSASQDDACNSSGAQYDTARVQEQKKDEGNVSILREVQAESAAGHRDEENDQREAQQRQNAPIAVWGDDSFSKLDLLVQADALIKRSLPKTSPTLSEDKREYLRSGVWSRAEEEYAAALLSFFLQGLLDLPEGTTLRKFLAEKLCCNRRRVSMKLGTESLAGQKIPRKVGASVFVAAQPSPTDEDRQEVERVLEELRYASFSLGPEHDRYHENDSNENHPQGRRFTLDEDAVEYHAAHQRRDRKGRPTRMGVKSGRGKPTFIRTGFESPEEEEFVRTMFEYFIAGVLDLPEGTKLVSYLCQQLNCTPKHLSMKLAPQRMGERKFPDNVGSITYIRKEAENGSPSSMNEEGFSEELFEVESRLTELRLACEEAHKNAPPAEVTPVKHERKSSIASVSSTGTASVASTPSASPVRSFRRSGPWSHDEEVYAAALIDCFFKGVLDIAEGTTLRAFLSSRLCCNPMRISKKLASECIAEIRIPKKLGSSTYVLRGEVTPEEQDETEEALRTLQQTYLHSSSRKRQRSSREGGPRPRAAMALDSDATESDSDDHSVASSLSEKILKTEKASSPAQEALRQQFQALHASPEASLKQKLV